MAPVTYDTLEDVAQEARPYPAELLEGAESGLVLCAAAFLGHNDAVHFALAGIRQVTLVDVDGDRLAEMRSLYRDSLWTWIEADAWEFARDVRDKGWTFDVVSVDTFTGDAEQRSLSALPLWTSLANRAVTLTASRDASYRLPPGWRSRIVWRSSDVYWLVLERST